MTKRDGLIIISEAPPELVLAEAGGKAFNLARMTHHGLAVPEWFAVSASAFRTFVVEHRLESLLAAAVPTADFAKRVSDTFSALTLPASLVESLRSELARRQWDDKWLAVRSSGLDEDGVKYSFAGQFSSFLYQRGFDAVSASIKQCWASAFSERALSYRVEHGIGLEVPGVGVVVQRMIDARAAGVAFSQHPLKLLETGSVLVSAVYGAGEGLVSGALDADSYVWDSRTGKIEKNLVDKTAALRRGSDGHLVEVAVDEDERKASVLDDHEITLVAKMAWDLERRLGRPQDMEWVLEEDRLYLVQTRPITGLPPAAYYDEKICGRTAHLWDNSNIIESYSGVTSPLTFSFASRAYYYVYVDFCQVMGVPAQLIEEKSTAFRNLLGLLRGRVYYNLPNWYQLVLILPGSSTNKSFMETMMGVRQSLRPELTELFAFAANPPRYSLGQKLKLFGKTVWRFVKIDAIIDDFFAHFNRVYNEARTKDLRAMSLPDLATFFYDLDSKFLKRWKAPIINDYLCMIFFGVLKNLVEKWLGVGGDSGDAAAALQNDLLCGEGNLDSTEPTKMLMRIAAALDKGPLSERELFLKSDPDTLWNMFRAKTLPAAVQRDVATFLDRYGFRCINELKLEEPDLHDDPRFIFASLTSYIRSQSYDIAGMEAREQEIRRKAEAVVAEKLSGLKLRIFRFVLKQARKAVRNRENLRFTRTKVFGISRHIFRAMGDKLCALELIDDPHDVFYLTLDELLAFIEGRGVSQDLRTVVNARAQEYRIYRETPPPPDRCLTYGAVGVTMPYLGLLMETDLLKGDLPVSDDPNVMYGTPCCPGVVEGRVRVVHSAADAVGMHDEILVTARTDPGWVPLFPACKGLLVERGSLLSHSAVVARELGLPTIVGIQGGLMQKLKTGDRVRVDAGKGEIRLLKDNEQEGVS